MVEDVIIQTLSKITDIPRSELHLEIPQSEEHGDYSSNVALRVKGSNPNQITEKISKDKELLKFISKVEVAGGGFINFWLKKDYLIENLREVIQKRKDYGKSEKKAVKINFEFGQPNTHKLPHIGHLFSYIYGSATSNILEFSGYDVIRTNYQGDIGLHVAKCLWAFIKEGQKIPENLAEKIDLLQKCYQSGSKSYEEDKKAKDEIDNLSRSIYAQNGKIKPIWLQTRSWSIDYYQKFEKRLGINYDKSYFESQVFLKAKDLVNKNTPKVFKKSEGAVIFPGSKYGLHDRVFLNSSGDPTYEAKDLALAMQKMMDSKADLILVTTAAEQNEYFKVMIKALEEIDNSFKGKFKHIGFGMVNLKSGKMSSRTGEFIGAIELVDFIVAKIAKLVEEREDLNEKEKKEVSEQVGIGAIKYSFLKNNYAQNSKFDINESIAKEGNSGPYLQYTYARIQSVLNKAKLKDNYPQQIDDGSQSINDEEMNLLRSFVRFQGVCINAAKTYSPNQLCNYLYDLAGKYNFFYNKYPILEERTKDIKQSEFRLTLTKATGQILKNGLKILGINTPQKM